MGCFGSVSTGWRGQHTFIVLFMASKQPDLQAQALRAAASTMGPMLPKRTDKPNEDMDMNIVDPLAELGDAEGLSKKEKLRIFQVQGSTAGAGSGDFHTYRIYRRKERNRLAAMETAAAE
eukprot:g32212.t1